MGAEEKAGAPTADVTLVELVKLYDEVVLEVVDPPDVLSIVEASPKMTRTTMAMAAIPLIPIFLL